MEFYVRIRLSNGDGLLTPPMEYNECLDYIQATMWSAATFGRIWDDVCEREVPAQHIAGYEVISFNTDEVCTVL